MHRLRVLGRATALCSVTDCNGASFQRSHASLCRRQYASVTTNRCNNGWNPVHQLTHYRSLHSLAPDDTIYALSTAPGRAAIAVIRISGPAGLDIYHHLCPNRLAPQPRTAALRRLRHPLSPENILDTGALVLYFPGPHTVTGEDILELHIHGGNAIVRGILDAIPLCISASKIRAAEAGEFTKRAFYNNRIDLTEVEALAESLAAETEQQRRLAVSGSSSALTTRYEEWRDMLLNARGELEALIDFSEDQHFDESPAQLMAGTSKLVRELKRQIEFHILNASRGELLRSGISVALLGAPNAGKSSLLNRIVGREAAIVSAEEGTTRDIVDVAVDLQGWLVRLGDMAGVRAGLPPAGETGRSTASVSEAEVGAIEREGIRRARERALRSDLVIVLVCLRPTPDGRVELALNSELLSAVSECRTAGKHMLFVLNKIDLLHTQTAKHKVSLSQLLCSLIETFPETDANGVFCLSCRDADQPTADELDAGGLQNFLTGLTRKFSDITSAAVGVTEGMNAAEAQGYWSASLSVTHRQSEYLRECLIHLDSFLESSSNEPEVQTLTALSQSPGIGVRDTSPKQPSLYFDTTDAQSPQGHQYPVDGHEDLTAQSKSNEGPHEAAPVTIPYSWASIPSTADMEEVDIVTAAEHLRSAATCLAKLTGRGDGVSSGADVEDVLGVVFEK